MTFQINSNSTSLIDGFLLVGVREVAMNRNERVPFMRVNFDVEFVMKGVIVNCLNLRGFCSINANLRAE